MPGRYGGGTLPPMLGEAQDWLFGKGPLQRRAVPFLAPPCQKKPAFFPRDTLESQSHNSPLPLRRKAGLATRKSHIHTTPLQRVTKTCSPPSLHTQTRSTRTTALRCSPHLLLTRKSRLPTTRGAEREARIQTRGSWRAGPSVAGEEPAGRLRLPKPGAEFGPIEKSDAERTAQPDFASDTCGTRRPRPLHPPP